MTVSGPAGEAPAPEAIAALLADAGHLAAEPRLIALSGGWNNRVYRLESSDSKSFLLKQYFPDPAGAYPRLAQEFAFCRHAHAQVPSRAPAPLACSRQAGLALYAWIEGQPYTSVSRADVAAAQAFILGLQAQPAPDLVPAAEACSRLSDHLSHLRARMERMQQIREAGEAHDAARALVAERLQPQWQRVEAKVAQQLALQPGLDGLLGPADRCLSPSDFGFHNALKTPQGPVFLDFEYAGWDDPAQLVCDFFAQFEVPAPEACYPDFAAAICSLYANADWHRERIELMRPAHLLKWCCIALNHFCPHKGARRRFARPSENRLQLQLQKAARLLDRIELS